MSALRWAVACGILFMLLAAGCDDSRPGSKEQEPVAGARQSGEPSTSFESRQRASDRVSSRARAENFAKSLARTTRDEVKQAFDDPATLSLLMELSPDEFYRALEQDPAQERLEEETDSAHARRHLYNRYMEEMAARNPEALAAFVETGPERFLLTPSVILAYAAPELGFASIEKAVLAKGAGANSEQVVAFKAVAEAIAEKNPELGIRLLNASTLNDRNLIGKGMSGFAGGVDREKYLPGELAGLLSKFSADRLTDYPDVARITSIYSQMKPAEVLPSFPLDGEPWQRAGAIAYLEAAAFKGMNGDMYVTEFLESPQASLLTDEERGRLRHILRK